MRVIIGDDHRVFAEALAMLLVAEPDMDVVGVGFQAHEVLQLVEAHRPDVVVLDYRLGSDDGIKLAQHLAERCPGAQAVVVTAHDTPAVASLAIRAGVAGFVPKVAPSGELVAALRAVGRGETWVSGKTLRSLLDDRIEADATAPTSGADTRVSQLTRRELEILRHLVAGHSRAAIAGALFLSANTVRTHIGNILFKLDVHSSLEAVVLAVEAGVPPIGVVSGGGGHGGDGTGALPV